MHIHSPRFLTRLPTGCLVPGPNSAVLARNLGKLIGRDHAARVLAHAGEIGVKRWPAVDLAHTSRIPLRVAEQLVAARDLYSPSKEAVVPSAQCESYGEALSHIPRWLPTLETEVILALPLSESLEVKAIVLVAKGGSTRASLDERDVFVPLVRLAAAAFILVHNHPNGDPTPSAADVVMTNRMARAGQTIGIELLDHIVVASRGSVSFRETALLPTEAEMQPDLMARDPSLPF